MKDLCKILVLLAISSLWFQGCGKAVNNENGVASPAADIPVAESPFPNKEPDKYQAEIWQVRGAVTEKYFVACNGKKWRIDSAYGDETQTTSLHTDKDYVLSYASKTYAEYEPGHGYDEHPGMIREMSLGMLNSEDKAVFEKLGTVDGITTYKRTSPTERGKESIISFDERLGLPVKKEVYKTAGERVLDVTVTLNGFKADVDEKLFSVPADFKKVPLDEMRKTLVGPPK